MEPWMIYLFFWTGIIADNLDLLKQTCSNSSLTVLTRSQLSNFPFEVANYLSSTWDLS